MIDAGGHQRAMLMLKSLNESVVETIEPRPDAQPARPPRLDGRARSRAAAAALRHPPPASGGSTSRSPTSTGAVERSYAAAPQVQRRVAIESARARLVEGKTELAEQIIHTTLSELGEGEGRTFARAHQALAECAIDCRHPGRPAAGRREPARGDQRVGGVLGVRPGPGLPDPPGARCAQPARPLRRGAGADRPAARRPRPLRRRALVHVRVRGLHPLQRQPARRRRAALRAHRRPRLPARQPPPRRPRGVGDGARRVTTDRPARRRCGGSTPPSTPR